jgi:hypothetical protein
MAHNVFGWEPGLMPKQIEEELERLRARLGEK